MINSVEMSKKVEGGPKCYEGKIIRSKVKVKGDPNQNTDDKKGPK